MEIFKKASEYATAFIVLTGRTIRTHSNPCAAEVIRFTNYKDGEITFSRGTFLPLETPDNEPLCAMEVYGYCLSSNYVWSCLDEFESAISSVVFYPSFSR